MKLRSKIFSLALFSGILFACNKQEGRSLHVFEIREIVLTSEKLYENPYKDVTCWVQLKGPDFNKRVYGFWDGGRMFKVRVAATIPGEWHWESGSNLPDDKGLNGKAGSFTAKSWSEEETRENPNRRGFIRPTPNGHALQYADGTPFFFLGDTWWAASTWRYPLSGQKADTNWNPGPDNLTFENIINYRKKQGYNSIAMISGFPGWAADAYPSVYIDKNGIGIRQAWEKFGKSTAKDMHDESGNLPFKLKEGGPLADFDQINPAFFQSLDQKMDYLDSVGFVPFLETVRRDIGPSWKAYFDWPDSFTRYIQYIVARYGAYNLIFSPLHLDWIPPKFSLSAEEFSEAIIAWYNEYGPLPFGQPVTSLINPATHIIYGTGDQAPWLTMHSVGNNPRNHGFYPLLEEQFDLAPAMPAANLEAYYPGWNQAPPSTVAGESAERNSARDNYFGRTQAWGSFLSGGLAGHMFGTGAYDGTTVGEQEGKRPFIWEALNYPAGKQVGYLRRFIKSEGNEYQNLQLASNDLHPRKSKNSHPDGLDGWAFMMRTRNRELAMVYFENSCEIPLISGLNPKSEYIINWFDPLAGVWLDGLDTGLTDESGNLQLKIFPDRKIISTQDWSLKLVQN